jgi:hypothetical protein
VHDDAFLVPGEVYRAWGDWDAEWIALDSCLALRGDNRGYWANALNGGHLVMGFDTIMLVVDHGTPFGQRINWGWTLPQAWLYSAETSMAAGARAWGRAIRARVVGEENCHFNDRKNSSCGDFAPNGYYYWLDHRFGSGPDFYTVPFQAASAASAEAANVTLPVLSVISALPSEGDLAKLSNAFGFSPDTPAALDDESQLYRAVDNGLDLSVDKQGKFSFANLNELWVVPTGTTTLQQRAALAADLDPKAIADEFLTSQNLMPPDAVFIEVVTDTVTTATSTPTEPTANSANSAAPAFKETILDESPIAYQVVYGRQLTVTADDSSSVVTPVFGPGATLRVYVGLDGKVVGASGGWRSVSQLSSLSTSASTTPLSSGQAISLYQTLRDAVNLLPTGYSADVVTVTQASLSYYEQPLGVSQDLMVPTYAMQVDMQGRPIDPAGAMGATSATETVTPTVLESFAFVPAVAEELPPLARITSYPDPQPIIAPDDVLTLTAADSSKMLSELGLGDNLTFVMGTAPFTYTWKLQNTGKVIGSGLSINYKAGIEDFVGSSKDNDDLALVVVLEVTDGKGKLSRASKAFYFLGTPPVKRVFAPSVAK